MLFLPPEGQHWTTFDELRAFHRAPFDFDRIHGTWWDRVIPTDAKQPSSARRSAT